MAPLVNIERIALRNRIYVESVIGKPASYKKRSGTSEIGDEAKYSWGEALYAKNHLVGLIVMKPSRPYEAALNEVGFTNDYVPFVREGDGTMLWRDKPFRSGIRTPSELSIDDVFLPADFSELHVTVLDVDDPGSWTDDQCRMWVRLSGSKIPEAAMHRGNILYWNLHPSHTIEDCTSLQPPAAD